MSGLLRWSISACRRPPQSNDPFHQESMPVSNVMPLLLAWYRVVVGFGSLAFTILAVGEPLWAFRRSSN